MNHLINDGRLRPFLRGTLPLIISTVVAGALAEPAAAQQIRIGVTGSDAQSLVEVRRRIAVAAGAVCDTGGLASLYRNAARRCREQVSADAERQLQAKTAARLAARTR